jgi:multiple sugar transport system permease protein
MTTASPSESLIKPQIEERQLVAGRRRSRWNESILGLLFIAPAVIVAFIFQLFPVVYGFYLSMQGGVNIPEGFVGLKHFISAVGSLAFIIAIAISLVFAIGGYVFYSRALSAMRDGGGSFYIYLIPGFVAGPATLFAFGLAFRIGIVYAIIPLVPLAIAMLIYSQLNAQRAKQGLGQSNFLYTINSWGIGLFTFSAVLLLLFTFSELYSTATPAISILETVVPDRRLSYVFPLFPQFLALAGTVAGLAAALTINAVLAHIEPDIEPRKYLGLNILRLFLAAAIIGFVVYVIAAQESLRASMTSFATVTTEELRAVTRIRMPNLIAALSMWPQVYTMLLGIGLTGLAYYTWRQAHHRQTTPAMIGTIFISILFMIGGWLFIGALPQAASSGDPDFFNSLLRTVTYAVLTVPVQLTLGLTLAYLLFHEIKRGKALYRLIYFMPYVAPTVATAAVFTIIFSNRDTAPANQFLQAVGLPAQQWLRNPNGVFQILAEIIGGAGTRLPSFLVGPSLPLLTAILYTIWVFSGYNAVIFMAGLGNIPADIYEAAQVDGAGRWDVFRKIIFPMISPTTYFLTVLAVIGTFRAFNHIWVLRTLDARGAMDTTTVYIYDTILTASVLKTRPYAAAMSFLLFGIILILTIIQNRWSRDRVFYG